jgi:spermidine/putrescine-binding protein
MGYVPAMREGGLLQPIDESLVPNLSKVLPLFRDDANLNADGRLWAVPFTWGGAPMMYDPKVFSTPPESWSIVLEPEFKGKFAMMDDPIGQMTIASIILNGPDNPTLITPDQLAAVQDWLINLKKNHARMLAPSFGEAADVLVRGDVQFTFGGWEAMKAWVADKGVIDFTYPSEGSYGFIDNYCIPANASNPELAHALCNQVLDRTAQIFLGDELIQGAVTQEGIDGLAPEKRAIYPYDNMTAFQEKCRFYPMTPFVSDGTHATWPDWVRAWQGVLAA